MTTRFLHEPGERISLLDLEAQCSFRTDSSIAFMLGRISDSTFWEVGFVDLHYPCDGDVLAQIRVAISEEYCSFERMRELVQQVFSALGIPADTTFHLNCFRYQSEFLILNDPNVMFSGKIPDA